MPLYSILISIIVVSFTTCIIATLLEKKELKLLKKISSSSSKKEKSNSSDILSKTMKVSSLTQTIEILDISEDNISEEYNNEPVIIAVLDEDASTTK